MNEEDTLLNFKNIFKSFIYWPRIFRLLWNVSRKNLIIITALYCMNGFLPTISIIVTQTLVNSIQIGIKHSLNYVLIPFILYVSLSYLSSVLKEMLNYFQGIFQLELAYKLNVITLEKANKLEMKDYENSEIYDMIKRAEDEAGNRPYQLFSSILSLISQIIALVSTMVILLIWKSWVIYLILIVPIISSIYNIKLGNFQYKIQWHRASEARKAWYYKFLITNDMAFKEIKLYNLGNFIINSYKNLYNKFVKQDKNVIIKRTTFSMAFGLLDEVLGAFIVWLIIKAAYMGEILLGNTIAYIRCISSVQSNTQGILSTIANMYQNNLYIKQFFDFLDLPTCIEKDEKSNFIEINEINNIEFKNVSFKYKENREYVLKNINFVIHKGEKIALVGENGSGKTTLIKLAVGFYDNYEGEILINGVSMRKINKTNMREKIGIVFQDYLKFEFTCRENIALGRVDYLNDDEKILSAADKADVKHMISGFTNGLDTQLGVWFEGGLQLSGGQWQKIALARAFIREADCYILDEPSSALDPVSEYEIFKKSYDLTEGKLGIFITHRLSNVEKFATRILVMSKGELVEEGQHDSLMKEDTLYSYLYKLQNENQNRSVRVVNG